jgi:transposase-like protein
MEERIRMLSDYDTGHWSVMELCRRYGVSRDTFYLWRARRSAGGEAWFMDGSHATRSCSHRTSDLVEAAVWICGDDSRILVRANFLAAGAA